VAQEALDHRTDEMHDVVDTVRCSGLRLPRAS